ncbi:MAG TPA: glycosyltransferase family 52 [Flavobacterium sp.]|jgi:hypothetical protein
MMNQTFVCCSTYHVYISILEAYKHKHEGYESVLIFLDDMIENIGEFVDNVEKLGVFKRVLRIKGYTIVRNLRSKYNFWRYYTQRSGIYIDLYEKHNPELLEIHEFMANSELNLFRIDRTRAYFLIKYKKNFFRMYEDGYGTYNQKLPPRHRRFNRKYITKFPLLKGHDPQVKEVLVSDPSKMTDKALIPKVKKLDLLQLESNLTDGEKEAMLNTMLGDISLKREKATIIITQPLFEDHFCTEEVKIMLYKEIIDAELAAGNLVYIKTHPRERTVYPFADPQIIYLPKFFPLEIFNLNTNLRIEKAISFFSTALFNLKHVDDKQLLGEDYLKERILQINRGLA